ncbi:hypothetical protein NE857_28210 [Nocardiopsis exhalans]|uniref:Uncharacterized protein n=1 Tax=Nocardiopsis exhalans TaxID=163604 RepID=A0ABY5D6L2_9ACTN|nr:hypothetical protein [Nocardiopsis exhalans]USY19113.1 hypothetical protein NE857_28210 [Nocardiopsis exhalans]
MESQLGDTAWETLPERVRVDLRDVDSLRAVWARQRQDQTLDARGAARRELTRDRVREWGADPALTDLLLTGSAVSGEPMTAPHIAALAGRVAELPAGEIAEGVSVPRAPRPLRIVLSSAHADDLARAATIPAHPVVRAAHTYAECVRVLAEAAGEESAGAESSGAHGPHGSTGPPGALPWVLASRVLQRADFPPLLLDPGAPPPDPCTERDPGERLAILVAHFARLVTGALRGELGWSRTEGPPAQSPVPPLTAVTRRRVLEYVRSRREPVALILRALAPGASATVTSGDGVDGADTGEGCSSRWWTCLELVVGEVSLALYVIVQDVGSPPCGVLAVTANARLVTPEGVRQTLEMSRSDSVTVMPTDCVDDRWPQVRDLVDEAVSRSMNELTRV